VKFSYSSFVVAVLMHSRYQNFIPREDSSDALGRRTVASLMHCTVPLFVIPSYIIIIMTLPLLVHFYLMVNVDSFLIYEHEGTDYSACSHYTLSTSLHSRMQ
jgi:hypothetical protein